MINANPEFIEVDGKRYKINTDYRVAIECDSISRDDSIQDLEKTMAIIYKLFGEEALKDTKNYEKIIELAVKYLLCGYDEEDIDKSDNKEPNMDYIQDEKYIYASFRSDYQIDIEREKLHWWTYFKLLNGLTEDCALNRVRYTRDEDISDIKDPKERERKLKQKKQFALKREKTILVSEKEKESIDKFYKLAGIKDRKE